MRYTKKDILDAAKRITSWVTGASESHKVIDMEKTIKIVLLDDGDTWSGDADIITLTEEGYNDLMAGYKFSQLDEKEILDSKNVFE